MTNEAKALVVVSSVTGNTRVVGHWLADAYAAGVLYTPETAPSDLTGFSTVLLGFWCDKGGCARRHEGLCRACDR